MKDTRVNKVNILLNQSRLSAVDTLKIIDNNNTQNLKLIPNAVEESKPLALDQLNFLDFLTGIMGNSMRKVAKMALVIYKEEYSSSLMNEAL